MNKQSTHNIASYAVNHIIRSLNQIYQSDIIEYKSQTESSLSRLKIVMDIDATMLYTEKNLTFKYANKIIEEYEEIKFEMKTISGSTCKYCSKLRPGIRDFLSNLSNIADLYIFTSATSTYANLIAQILDPNNQIFKKIWSIEDITTQYINYKSCTPDDIVVRKTHAKDLQKVFGDEYDPLRTILIDDNKDYHVLNPDNGIHIPYFSPYKIYEDVVLYDICDFIINELQYVKDVRPPLCNKYLLRHKNNMDELNIVRSFQ
jgi:TFIIF-interacting CTD phosphatase-like protein